MIGSRSSASSFLRVGHSQITGLNGRAPGLGLFAVSSKNRKVAFKEGESIISSVKFAPALCITTPEGNLEWLYSGNKICGLKEADYVIWSGVKRYITIPPSKKKKEVEFGGQPDSLLIYANHSDTPEGVNSIIDIDQNTQKQRKGLKRKAEDVTYRLRATKDIYHNEEILWDYGGGSKADFTYSYRRPFEFDRDAKRAKRITAKITGVNENKLEAMIDISSFNESRWKEQMDVAPRKFELSSKEKMILDSMDSREEKNQLKIKSCLDKCSWCSKEEVIIAYLKKRLNDQPSIYEFLKKTQSVFNTSGVTLPGKTDRISVSALYQFCVVNHIIVPEHSPEFIPPSWLVEKLNVESGSLYFNELLVLNIRSYLIKANANKKEIAAKLRRRGVPNPLENNKIQWKPSDLETLVGHTANIFRDRADEQEVIKQYLEASPREVLKHMLSIHDMASRGSLDGVKSIAIRYLTRKGNDSPNKFLSAIKTSNVQMIVNGENVPPDINSLKKFVREHFSQEERRKIKGYWFCNNQELLDRLKSNKKGNSKIHSEFYKRIREGDRTLLKPFIEQRCIAQPSLHPSVIIKKLRHAKVLTDEKEYFTSDTLYELFKNDQGKWIDKVFYLKRATDEELLRKLKEKKDLKKSAKGENAEVYHELILRCQANPSLIKDYLQACKSASSNNHDSFLGNMVRKFKQYNINKKNNWTKNDISELMNLA